MEEFGLQIIYYMFFLLQKTTYCEIVFLLIAVFIINSLLVMATIFIDCKIKMPNNYYLSTVYSREQFSTNL